MSIQRNLKSTKDDTVDKIVTIPNILSMVRLLLIPVFVWLYCVKDMYEQTAMVLVLSGITDLVDGFIARRFHMISNVGKILDPIADKLTQAAALFCLLTRFQHMMIPFILIFVKEISSAVMGAIVVKKTGKVEGADWHGKVTTVLLYSMMILHVLWHDISMPISDITITICVSMMLLSFLLYAMRHIRALKSVK